MITTFILERRFISFQNILFSKLVSYKDFNLNTSFSNYNFIRSTVLRDFTQKGCEIVHDTTESYFLLLKYSFLQIKHFTQYFFDFL